MGLCWCRSEPTHTNRYTLTKKKKTNKKNEIPKPPPKVRDLNRSVLFLYCSFTISSELPKPKEIWIPWWWLCSMWSTAASRVALNLLLRQLCSKQSYICVKPWCGDQKIRPSYENILLKTEIQNTDLLTSKTCLLQTCIWFLFCLIQMDIRTIVPSFASNYYWLCSLLPFDTSLVLFLRLFLSFQKECSSLPRGQTGQ